MAVPGRGELVELVPPAAITTDASEALVAMLVAGAGIGMRATFVPARRAARVELVPMLEGTPERRA